MLGSSNSHLLARLHGRHIRNQYEFGDRKTYRRDTDTLLRDQPAALLRISSGVEDTTSTYFGMNLPPSMYLMNSGLISLARILRMRACSSMSAHSAIRKKRCGSSVSRQSTPSFTCALDLCMGLPSE